MCFTVLLRTLLAVVIKQCILNEYFRYMCITFLFSLSHQIAVTIQSLQSQLSAFRELDQITSSFSAFAQAPSAHITILARKHNISIDKQFAAQDIIGHANGNEFFRASKLRFDKYFDALRLYDLVQRVVSEKKDVVVIDDSSHVSEWIAQQSVPQATSIAAKFSSMGITSALMHALNPAYAIPLFPEMVLGDLDDLQASFVRDRQIGLKL